MTDVQMPYFDHLLASLSGDNPIVKKSFGRHVHWGYWAEPEQAICDDEDFARAAECLTLELCGMAGVADGERVLDVGCGFGGTIASLNERFSRLQLVGVNIDARQLDRARQLVTPMNGNEIQFQQGDACDLPFPDASFDRLLAVECIFHFPSRQTFFKQASRVLKPGGTLALSDFLSSPLLAPVNKLVSLPRFQKYNVFGHCKIEHSAKIYHKLAMEAGLIVTSERNVTRQTLPTYRYLESMIRRLGGKTTQADIGVMVMRLQQLLGMHGPLRYHLLSFQQP